MNARADGYLTALSGRMRANAERVVAAFERNPDFAKDAVEVHRQVDGVVHGLSRVAAPSLEEVSLAWRNLIGMAASATVVEEPSGEHGVRVAALAITVAEALSLPAEVVQLIEQAALLHDLGKSAVPSDVLSKTETLTEHEAFLLERHAEDGARLIEKAPLSDRSRIAEVVRLHHHPYDGVGIDRQLRGDDLPIAARILAACDRFDALVTGRPRRPAIPVAEALREILRASGREFDPKVVDALIGSVRRIQVEHGDVISYLSRDAGDFTTTSRRGDGCAGHREARNERLIRRPHHRGGRGTTDRGRRCSASPRKERTRDWIWSSTRSRSACSSLCLRRSGRWTGASNWLGTLSGNLGRTQPGASRAGPSGRHFPSRRSFATASGSGAGCQRSVHLS